MPKKKVISMLEFLRTGMFGELSLGSTKNDMLQFLGEPSAWGNSITKDLGFCIYGDVEFHWWTNTNKIRLIHFDHFSRINDTGEYPRLHKSYELDPWVIRSEANMFDIQNALSKQQIPFSRVNKLSTWDALILESGCEINFDSEDRDFFGLVGISCNDRSLL
jgi:hypothetical protein